MEISAADIKTYEFQSTPPVRGATSNIIVTPAPASLISIHAPRAGGDSRLSTLSSRLSAFQSTPPVRGATQVRELLPMIALISIHAPRAGGDSAFVR